MEIACHKGAAILFEKGKELVFKTGGAPLLLRLWPLPAWCNCFEGPGRHRIFNLPAQLPELVRLDGIPGFMPRPAHDSGSEEAFLFFYTLCALLNGVRGLAGALPVCGGRKAVIASDFIRMVQEEGQVQRVSHYAGRLCVTEGYLAKCLKSAGLAPPKQCIRAAICDKAQPLLSEGRYSIMEIAELLGFEAPSGFSNFFKSCKGLSPAAYRRIYNPQ